MEDTKQKEAKGFIDFDPTTQFIEKRNYKLSVFDRVCDKNQKLRR
jgi:hypothetical protein